MLLSDGLIKLVFPASEVNAQAAALTSLTDGLPDGELKDNLLAIVASLQSLASSLNAGRRMIKREATAGKDSNFVFCEYLPYWFLIDCEKITVDIDTYTSLEAEITATINDIHHTDLASLAGEMKITVEQFLDNLLEELRAVNADMTMKKEFSQNLYYRFNC